MRLTKQMTKYLRLRETRLHPVVSLEKFLATLTVTDINHHRYAGFWGLWPCPCLHLICPHTCLFSLMEFISPALHHPLLSCVVTCPMLSYYGYQWQISHHTRNGPFPLLQLSCTVVLLAQHHPHTHMTKYVLAQHCFTVPLASQTRLRTQTTR